MLLISPMFRIENIPVLWTRGYKWCWSTSKVNMGVFTIEWRILDTGALGVPVPRGVQALGSRGVEPRATYIL